MNFTLYAIMAFLIGGGYILMVVWLSEKLGSRVGAAIAGLPSTILIGLIFIVLTEGAQAGRTAVSVVPFMFSATLIYALVYIYIVERLKSSHKYLVAILGASFVWLITSLAVRQAGGLPFIFIAMFGIASLIIFWRFLYGVPVVGSIKVPLPKNIYLLRFIVGGSLISGSVIAAKVLDPTWGGIIASFPAMLGIILFFLNRSQGEKFLKGFVKNLPLSYVSSLTFVIVVHAALTNIPSAFSFILGVTASGLYMLILLTAKPQFARIKNRRLS